jgi:hypothetical protein
MSLNATIQRLVDDLFADKLISGFQATEKITWKVRTTEGYSPISGEVTMSEVAQEIAVITGDPDSGFPSAVSASESGGGLGAEDEVVLQMQPLADRTSKEALGDSFLFNGKEYAVKNVDVIRLANKPMLWKVIGA